MTDDCDGLAGTPYGSQRAKKKINGQVERAAQSNDEYGGQAAEART